MRLQDRLQQLSRDRKALLAANFYNFETLSGILQGARSKRTDIILQLSESSIEYLGLELAADLARAGLKAYGVRGWLHLDHGSSVDMVQRCLDAGFDSVMIDASEKPLWENIRITAEIVKIAEKYKANVEAELGYIPKLGQPHTIPEYTQPEDAKRFVDATGVNALAIAVGTAHGFYKETPKLQLGLIAEIHAATSAALVLHGGSGIDAPQLKAAIRNGISKINLATETKNIFMKKLQQILTNNDEIDLRKVFPVATAEVINLIGEKIETVFM